MYYGWIDTKSLNDDAFRDEHGRDRDIFEKLRLAASWDSEPLEVHEECPLDDADEVISEIIMNAYSSCITEFFIDDDGVITIVMDAEGRRKAVREVMEMQDSETARNIVIARLLFKRRIPEDHVSQVCSEYYRPGTDYRKYFC